MFGIGLALLQGCNAQDEYGYGPSAEKAGKQKEMQARWSRIVFAFQANTVKLVEQRARALLRHVAEMVCQLGASLQNVNSCTTHLFDVRRETRTSSSRSIDGSYGGVLPDSSEAQRLPRFPRFDGHSPSDETIDRFSPDHLVRPVLHAQTKSRGCPDPSSGAESTAGTTQTGSQNNGGATRPSIEGDSPSKGPLTQYAQR